MYVVIHQHNNNNKFNNTLITIIIFSSHRLAKEIDSVSVKFSSMAKVTFTGVSERKKYFVQCAIIHNNQGITYE